MSKSIDKQLSARRAEQDLTLIRATMDQQRLEEGGDGAKILDYKGAEKPMVVRPESSDAENERKRRKITRDTFSDEKGKRLSVDLPETVFKAVGVYCANEGMTRADLTFNLFIKHLMKEGYLK